jgi:hypothetical protein
MAVVQEIFVEFYDVTPLGTGSWSHNRFNATAIGSVSSDLKTTSGDSTGYSLAIENVAFTGKSGADSLSSGVGDWQELVLEYYLYSNVDSRLRISNLPINQPFELEIAGENGPNRDTKFTVTPSDQNNLTYEDSGTGTPTEAIVFSGTTDSNGSILIEGELIDVYWYINGFILRIYEQASASTETKKWNGAPPEGTRLAVGGLAEGLVQFYRGVNGSIVEEVTGLTQALPAGYSLRHDAYGTYIHNDGTGASVAFDEDLLDDSWTDDITLVHIYHLNGVADTNRTLLQSAGANDDAWELSIDAGNDMGGRIGTAGTWLRVENDITGHDNEWFWGAIQRTTGVGQRSIVPDEIGAWQTTSTAAPNQMNTVNNHDAVLFQTISSSAISIAAIGIWKRQLTPEEMASFYAAPWQVFEPPSEDLDTAFIQVPWTTQPPAGTPIDWDNPLAEGLTNFIMVYPSYVYDPARGIMLL